MALKYINTVQESTLNKITPGTVYRLKGTKSYYTVRRRNHSIEVQDYDWRKFTVVTHNYSVSLTFFMNENGEQPSKWNRNVSLSLKALENGYIKVSKKKAKTLKILFGKSNVKT